MSFLLFATAITLSVIAAFYAVAGLVAIFAASAIPIMIMGGALESAKLVVASWLYRNWREIPVLMKTYFTVALIILMLLTSMGIFGYLSKAHLDQAVPTGDIQATLNLIDEKILTQKENVNASRKQIAQLDSIAEQAVSRTADASGLERANQIRRGQAKERSKLFAEIETSQAEIAKLNKERAPVAAEVRKVEAEVGPIKYIAALIYGDQLDNNLLESAVRIVIIMIVLVFDPLAVLMLIAWNREQRKNNPLDDPGIKAFFDRGKEVAQALDKGEPIPEKQEEKPEIDKHAYLKKKWVWKVPGVEPVGPLVAKPEEPVEQPKEDWHEDLYKRVDQPLNQEVPEKTQDFLETVQKIKDEPLGTMKLVQETPFSAKEDDVEVFTLNTDIKEVLEKPTNGRPERYK
jgi:hypothetical protein